MYNVIYELERSWRMYILMEGIFTLIDKYPVILMIFQEFPVKEEKGYVLLEIVSKIA